MSTPIRDAPTPSREELDRLAEITPADVEHAMQTARELAPAMSRFLEAEAESEKPTCRRRDRRKD